MAEALTAIYAGMMARGLLSFPFPLNLSLLCPFPLNLSSLVPPNNPNQPVDVSQGAQVELSNVSDVFPKVLKLSSEVSECKPLDDGRGGHAARQVCGVRHHRRHRRRQGLTLVQFSAQCKRFLWDRGCMKGLFKGCLRGVSGW